MIKTVKEGIEIYKQKLRELKKRRKEQGEPPMGIAYSESQEVRGMEKALGLTPQEVAKITKEIIKEKEKEV